MYDTKKIVLLGHPATGKSAFAVQLAEKRFAQKHDSTIEDSYQLYMDVDDAQVKVELLDTAGDERYEHIRSKQLQEGNGFILCFSLVDRSSFYSVRRYYQDIVKAHQCTTDEDCKNRARNTSTTKLLDHDTPPHSMLSTPFIPSTEQLAKHAHADPNAAAMDDEACARMQERLQIGVVLVGMKSDLVDMNDRVISEEEIFNLSKELHVNYHEVSNKRLNEITTSMEDVIRVCRLRNAAECICTASQKKKQECHCREVCAHCHRTKRMHDVGVSARNKSDSLANHCELTHPFISESEYRRSSQLHTHSRHHTTSCCTIQ